MMTAAEIPAELLGMVGRYGKAAHVVKDLPGARVTACTRRPVTRAPRPGMRVCRRCERALRKRDRFERPRVIYLIHFDQPFGHARHYMGSTDDLAARTARHLSGNGSRLMRHVNAAGITWRVVRTWVGDRNIERQMKCHGHGRRCPVCRGEPVEAPA